MADDYDQAHSTGGMRADERVSQRGGKHDVTDDFSHLTFKQVFGQTRMAMAVSDPNLEDNPLVFVNEAFCRLTGYSREEAEGQNCRFLQGPDTDPDRVQEIRQALDDEDVIVTELKNYRKDGTPFWNALHVGPIYDEDGKLLYYFGSQWDVSDVHSARAEEKTAQTLARELSHRMKNMFAVMNAIVSMTGRAEETAKAAANKISGRIMALGRAHEATLNTSETEPLDLAPMLRTVLAPYGSGERLIFGGPPVRLDSNLVSMLSLTLHELAINAIKYGALSEDAGEEGRVSLSWRSVDDEKQTERLQIEWRERGGPPVSEPNPDSRGTGAGIISSLLGSADGKIDYDWDPAGLTVTLSLPLPEAKRENTSQQDEEGDGGGKDGFVSTSSSGDGPDAQTSQAPGGSKG